MDIELNYITKLQDLIFDHQYKRHLHLKKKLNKCQMPMFIFN